MTIILKNKDTLQYKEFIFRCATGKNGLTKNKIEGDQKTPKGTFGLEELYYREDKINKPETKLKCVPIKKNMVWCDDSNDKKNYNKLLSVKTKSRHEKLFKKNKTYDLLIPIKYNFQKPIAEKGSAIFIHLTENFNQTAGCISLIKKDLLILLRLIDRNTKIKI
jgi:L,D-peptidoglycan transpeptidase YkuD (ErfK/YbiS/YcfS/YnhG family)